MSKQDSTSEFPSHAVVTTRGECWTSGSFWGGERCPGGGNLSAQAAARLAGAYNEWHRDFSARLAGAPGSGTAPPVATAVTLAPLSKCAFCVEAAQGTETAMGAVDSGLASWRTPCPQHVFNPDTDIETDTF